MFLHKQEYTQIAVYLLACCFSCQWSSADLYHPGLCVLSMYSKRGSVLYRSAKFTSNLFTLKTTDENFNCLHN